MLRKIAIHIWRKKNKNLVKRSKITTHQLKAIENPNVLTLL